MSFKELVDATDDMMGWLVLAGPVVAWLCIVPIFWWAGGSPSKPEGYDGCTYGKKCEEEIQRFLNSSSPDQKNNENAATKE